ncbi:MAG: hypothetical protein NT062_28285 [Proteobacteria bacterium]|nr:hypothetical protein [Pseudomonadota bacterium]
MMNLRQVVVVTVLALGGCGKGDKADKGAVDPGSAAKVEPTKPAAGSAVGSSEPAATTPDPSDAKFGKASLTDDKLVRYIKAITEGGNPFGALGAMMGSDGSLAKADTAMKEQEAFAKKQGFADAAEFMDIAGRVMLGETMLSIEAQSAGMRATLMKSIADAEKAATDPASPAETKAMMAEMAQQQKDTLKEMDAAPSGELNAADLALVKKYLPQLTAAEKASAPAAKH